MVDKTEFFWFACVVRFAIFVSETVHCGCSLRASHPACSEIVQSGDVVA